ncbi:conserved hypothetical protein [Verticillium alfalfae VaMs.102]|uniref:Ketopantoate reductase C-terminal domain-containing protein n=1 Tax=Verticillium alfalfae (strain VaMs.102 / ATCC MYA-4576 / FGSC 10136) TaxID=526221 RepID=C9SC22_VERA1|nr:conserved hypothetical protein [Verticillium alfalfae VaMs.102]EEY15906.1 conserved hypothetical protein [Verticillium alfalfae VaMs.102]
MAATVPGAATLGITHEKKEGFKKVLGMMPEQNDQELYAIFRADSLNRFYVPAVMMGHEEPAPPSSRTVHILGSDSRSKFLSHSLYGVYDSIQTIHSGTTTTQLDPSSEKWLRTQGMLSKFAAATDLRARGLPLDSWLALKIPSLMFSSVVDPICVLLDCHYEQLLFNPTANRLIGQLLDEIANVVERMPELRRASPMLQAALRGEGMRKDTIGRLRGKKGSPSKMVTQIERGQLTDIDYLNGYFIQRGKRLGVDMPANEMVVGMVKAKHKAQLQKLRSYIPMEMTSRL